VPRCSGLDALYAIVDFLAGVEIEILNEVRYSQVLSRPSE